MLVGSSKHLKCRRTDMSADANLKCGIIFPIILNLQFKVSIEYRHEKEISPLSLDY